MKTNMFFLIVLFSVSLFFSCELTESETTPIPSAEIKFPADTEEEFFALINNPSVKMIRNFDDLKKKRNDRTSPFYKLSNDAYKDFKTHLKFKNNALSTCKVDLIKDELSLTDYYIVLGDFGISEWFVTDHEGYECFNPGDCKAATSHICTSNC